jgi:hypothetical protein
MSISGGGGGGGWKGDGHDRFDCQFEVVVRTVNPELHERLALAVHLPTSDCLRHLYMHSMWVNVAA